MFLRRVGEVDFLKVDELLAAMPKVIKILQFYQGYSVEYMLEDIYRRLLADREFSPRGGSASRASGEREPVGAPFVVQGQAGAAESAMIAAGPEPGRASKKTEKPTAAEIARLLPGMGKSERMSCLKDYKYTVPELKQIAKACGLKGYSKLVKNELYEFIGSAFLGVAGIPAANSGLESLSQGEDELEQVGAMNNGVIGGLSSGNSSAESNPGLAGTKDGGSKGGKAGKNRIKAGNKRENLLEPEEAARQVRNMGKTEILEFLEPYYKAELLLIGEKLNLTLPLNLTVANLRQLIANHFGMLELYRSIK